MELTQSDARALLTEYAATVRSRPERIRAAVDAGLSKAEIARLLEAGRDLVYHDLKILREREDN